MNLNDSILSSASTAQPTLGRIVANVVDMQQQLVSQFEAITASLESLKIAHTSAIQLLREDLRRTDDRAQKQVDEIRAAHKGETDRLLGIITTMLERDRDHSTARAEPRPAQSAYAAGASPASFFANSPAAPGATDLLRQAMLAQAQDPQIMQRMMMQQMQAMQAQAQSQMHLAMSHPAASGNVFNAASSHTQMGGSPSVAVAKPPMPTVTVPKPTVGTVTLPISEPMKPAVTVVTPSAVKKEEKPATPSVTVAKPSPVISFGGFSGTAPAGSIFGKPAATTPVAGSIFGTPKAPTAAAPAPIVPSPAAPAVAEQDEDDHPEEYEPPVDFKPVVPLPELVDVVTGEEDEEILFEERCKLYRYAETKEWKERGTGDIKILKNKQTGRYRIVMRREQVHKVCANHTLASDMSITKKSEKAVLWQCMDFTEETATHEQLSARFGSVEKADCFMKLFKEGVAAAENGSPAKPAPAESKVKPAAKKVEEKTTEEKEKTAEGFGDQYKKKEGEWDCTGCYTRQPADKETCNCCGTNRDGSQGEKDIFAKKNVLPAPAPGKFSFGLAAANAAKDAPVVTSTPKAGLFGSSLTGGAAAPKFSFGTGSSPASTSSSPSTSIFGGSKLASATEGAGKTATPSFSFAKKEGTSTDSPGTAATTASASPVTFSFKAGTAGAGNLFGAKPSIFGQSTKTPEKDDKKEDTPNANAGTSNGSGSVFGSTFSKGISFGSVAKANTSIFDKENTEKAQAQFASLSKGTPLLGGKKDQEVTEPEGDDEAEGGEEEYEPNVEFQPQVPLPELIEVVTGEEDEEVLFKERAKLFRFDREVSQNKERGTGDIKILKNPKTGKCRVVMRREQVHKLCANFQISSDIKIAPKQNMPNVYMWSCKDFAESTEGSHETFTIKFKNEEIAKRFHDVFTSSQ